MTMRSYSGLLVLEDLFDYIPDANPDIANFATGIFSPSVTVTEQDCGTTLGNIQAVNYELEGAVELATDVVISKARIDQLLSAGIYFVATRTLDTCVASGGICQACFAASRQRLTVPPVGNNVVIQPSYTLSTTVISGTPIQNIYPLDLDTTQYETTDVYIQGTLLSSDAYSITGKTFTLTTALTENENIVVHYLSLNRAPFLVWLAQTYSGSMLGMKPLPSPMLPVRSQLITSIVPQSRLELLMSYTTQLTKIPQNFRDYMLQIKQPLERALYMLAINSIFANVTS